MWYVQSTYWLEEASRIGGCGTVVEVRMNQGVEPSLVIAE